MWSDDELYYLRHQLNDGTSVPVLTCVIDERESSNKALTQTKYFHSEQYEKQTHLYYIGD